MGKGRFLNQKLGKRVDRKFDLLKAHLASERRHPQATPERARPGKKGVSREAGRTAPPQP